MGSEMCIRDSYWLANKNLITQNIDGLDGKAGNNDYIPIHGRLDQMTLFHSQVHTQGVTAEVVDTPWDRIVDDCKNKEPENKAINRQLLELFSIEGKPELNVSYKPFVLLFDEYYTCLLYTSPSPRDLSTSRMPSSA